MRPQVRAAHQAHLDSHGTHACWTIQGNDLATWAVEYDPQVTASGSLFPAPGGGLRAASFA